MSQLKGKKIQDVYTKVCGVRNIVFSDQTDRFQTRSQQGNKYIMEMVVVEPLKSQKDPELMRACRTMMLRLKRAGSIPKKHVSESEVSKTAKDMSREQYNMEMELELILPGCHRRNTAEVAI